MESDKIYIEDLNFVFKLNFEVHYISFRSQVTDVFINNINNSIF